MNRRNLLKTSGVGLASLALPQVTPTGGVASLVSNRAPNRQLRIAHLTDVHMQSVVGAAKGFARCLHHVQNLPEPPDLLMNGGDAIMEAHGRGRSSVERQWRLYNEVLAANNSLSTLSCVGNHDIWCREESTQALADGKQWAMDNLQLPTPYYSLDRNGWHLIVLDSVQANTNGSWYTAHLDEAQFDWLKKDLTNVPATTPVLVFSHVPILAACVFFDGKRYEGQTWNVPGRWMHTDARQLVDLFHQHPNVKACLSGHIHLTDRVDYNGVSYYCNGAVSGAWWFGNYQHTQAGYALVDLYEDGSVQNQYVTY
ncbi:metallophosphoesterase [Fibrella aestuarina BUZ 2]|uniref:Metallophosphoesterase n=1 Tax=Fibrella aestuarina BUZ 2 TaxID=1166018 RepID=I0K3R1_9BACT|nr:metallophosphoesterase [Fibrella aestuarina]CCG98764.1 metallophosphoesterase [Fibrella aestuarina BUZ 2]